MQRIRTKREDKAAKGTNANKPGAKTGKQQYSNQRITLQTHRETLGNYEPRSQAAFFQFMMELEEIGGDSQKRPFR